MNNINVKNGGIWEIILGVIQIIATGFLSFSSGIILIIIGCFALLTSKRLRI